MSSSRDALRAWFLGPRAENAELFERLVTEALRDHVFWRRNYHPEDGFTIHETDKRSEGYDEAVATLTQELLGLLAELKRGVPFFSGRYKGHMSFEQTIASQIGYFAAMLFTEAAKRAGKTLTREGLITALEGIRGFQSGILPPVTIGADHETQKQGFWVRVEKGRFRQLTDWLSSE